MGATRILPWALATALLAPACSSNDDRGPREIDVGFDPGDGSPGPSGPIGAPIAGGNGDMQPPPPPQSQQPTGDQNGGECGMIKIEPMVMFSPGNLLVVFDRSMSMSTPFEMGGAATRLDEARNAIKTALAPLVCPDTVDVDGINCVDEISAALLTFPTDDGVNGVNPDPLLGLPPTLSCTVDLLDSPEQMPWQGVSDFYKNFDPYWDARTLNAGGPLFFNGMYPLVFGTPISVAFERANTALMDPAVVGNKAVLFLTDGEETPGCMGGVNPPQQAGQWEQMGIPTYVVSVAPASGPGQAFNDQVASNGGTGQSITPTNSQQLTEEISRIVMNTVGQTTCEVVIQDAQLLDFQAACEQGDVFVGPTKVPCDQAMKSEGFYVKNENTIEIVGSFCGQLEEDQRLEARFPCALIVK